MHLTLQQMKSRDFALLILGAVIGLVSFGVLRGCVFSGPEKMPTLAGRELPNANYVIDFAGRYNVICNDYKGAHTYENVKILGYTGKAVRESSGSLSSGYGFAERWLVVELPDKRQAYFSPSSISSLEQASPPSTK